jgi:hypothetical protein
MNRNRMTDRSSRLKIELIRDKIRSITGCNERQRLEGEKGIINELVKHKEYRSITTLLIRLGLPRVTISRVGLSNYDRGV